MKTILCAVAGSAEPLEALQYAARLARALSARLVLLHVEAPPRGGVLAGPWSADEPPDEERWSAVVSDILGGKAEVHFATGDAGAEIVEFARKAECDLIVLGSRARRAASLAIGSVVGRVIPHAPCPVIVVPAAGEEGSAGVAA